MNTPIIDNLATDKLESVDGLEVVTSQVELPAKIQLPTQMHPGEELRPAVLEDVVCQLRRLRKRAGSIDMTTSPR